ncbi:MAG: hypothetical protein WCP18_03840 [bacterium]
MLVTSIDLFWVVLSFVILFVGVAVGWGFVYIALMLRDIQQITSGLRKKSEVVDEILDIIKDRVSSAANQIPTFVNFAAKIIQGFKEKKKSSPKKKK